MKLVMKLKNHAMSDDTENDRHNVMQPENGSVDWRANKDSWYSSCDQDRQVELGRSCNMYRWSIIVMQIECRTLCVVCEIEHTGCAVSSTVGWLHALASITRLFFWHGKLFFLLSDARTVTDTGHSNYILQCDALLLSYYVSVTIGPAGNK